LIDRFGRRPLVSWPHLLVCRHGKY
jgi:hypothetical protein